MHHTLANGLRLTVVHVTVVLNNFLMWGSVTLSYLCVISL